MAKFNWNRRFDIYIRNKKRYISGLKFPATLKNLHLRKFTSKAAGMPLKILRQYAKLVT
jgi:hypothetical protein